MRPLYLPPILVAFLSFFAAEVEAADGSPASVFRMDVMPSSTLRSDLERLAPGVRTRALDRIGDLAIPSADLPYLRVDRQGDVFYADPPADPAETRLPAYDPDRAPAAPMMLPLDTSIDRSRVFKLHSNPGASRVVYLNFKGGTITGTAWNASAKVSSFSMLPYSEDADTANLSQAEADTIAEVWKRIGEDYAPFDVDITTERPASFGPQVGQILFSPRRDANGAYIYGGAVGGVAYVGVWGFGNFTYYQPALVFPEGTGSAKALVEAGSHELGHNLGLSHDGTASLGYYDGQGSGHVSWAPLMGVGYYTNVTQWSKGEYTGANNPEDDLAIIAGNLGYRADDHGRTPATATPLVATDNTITSETPVTDPFRQGSSANRGVIGKAGDIDLFAIDLAQSGPLEMTVTPAWLDDFDAQGLRSANLDIRATLYREGGSSSDPNYIGVEVATDDQSTDTYARVTASVTPGRYYLAVQGVGRGNPATTGYSSYGSLGQYFINGTAPVGNFVTVAVRKSGQGRGKVRSSPSGISCGSTCSDTFPADALVTLTAVPGADAQFAYWGGACSGRSKTCSLRLSEAGTATAVFNRSSGKRLVVRKAGKGGGMITSKPAGMKCGDICSVRYARDTVVRLKPRAAAGSSFAGWKGPCRIRGDTCIVRMSDARQVTARFRAGTLTASAGP